MTQRQRVKTQGSSLKVTWQDLPWKKIHRHVFRLQKRIYQASQRGDVRTVHKLQNLLSQSWYARLLAVRRVTQENRGKRTAGIDGAKSLSAPARWRLARQLHLGDKATALRRIWIPKRGSSEKSAGHSNPTRSGQADAGASSLGTAMGSQAVGPFLWISPRSFLPRCHRCDLSSPHTSTTIYVKGRHGEML